MLMQVEAGLGLTPPSMVGVMLLGQWVGLVGMATYIAKAMEQTLLL